LVEETGGGLLYDPRAPHELADGLARLMDDPRLRSTLAVRGRAAVREKFNDKVMADETWKIYGRIVGGL
jgi:glycosyltransferase involved in cell wall biosynthesis